MEILGIDIGGSGMKAAIVDIEKGELVSERYRIPTPKPSKPKAMAAVVKELVTHFDWNGPIGCAFPAVIDRGISKVAGNLDAEWTGTNVKKLFSKTVGNLPLYVANDADVAGLAEMKLGAGKGKNHKVILITIGTGLGSGVFYNGVLIPNIELGRIFHIDGKPIEFYASDAARKREGLKLKEWAVRFDFFLNHIIRISSPNYIIIGGGLSKKFDKFKDYLSVDVPIEVAHFRNNAGIIGAAMYAQSKLTGTKY